MITPPSPSYILLATRLASRKGPLKLSPTTLSKSSSVTSWLGIGGLMPALLTRMSTLPKWPYDSSMRLSTDGHFAACTLTARALRPRPRTSSATFSQLSILRLAMITSAPRSANARTIW